MERNDDMNVREVFPRIIRELIETMVESPNEVGVDAVVSADSVIYTVRVAPGDTGRVIGKQGSFITALRKVISTAGFWQGRRIMLDIAEPSRRSPGSPGRFKRQHRQTAPGSSEVDHDR